MSAMPVPGTGVGQRSSGVEAVQLPNWASTQPSETADKQPEGFQSRFEYRPDINKKVVLWQGDICKLSVDAIVNSTNETLNDMSGISGDIFRAAGGQLEDECNALEGCRTGEAKSTRAYNLPCQRIIHTAGPRFNVKYRTAAENALHSSYRHCLQVLLELELSTIGFCCINSEKKGYPRESATHIACRTVRRFMEHHGEGISLVVFCVDNTADLECYRKILPLYMPRSQAEEWAVNHLLPEDTGNEYGETECEERKIRIKGVPGVDLNKPVAFSERDDISDVQASFGAMRADPDSQRMSTVTKSKSQRDMEDKERTYARYLQRAKAENLGDIERMELLQVGGTDEMGRTVVVLVAHHFPHSSEADYDRLLLYLIRELDAVVERDFVVVYFHTKLDSERQPPFAWIKKAMSLLTRKYRKNLKSLLIVHPTMLLKMMFWLLTPFVSSKFWEKLVYVDRLEALYRYVAPELVRVPKFIADYDGKLWGGMKPSQKADDPEKDL